MIRPAEFGYNRETQATNAFQAGVGLAADKVGPKAMAEFDGVVGKLRSAGVNVLVIDDTPEPAKPDAVFPNNWISFHRDGTVILYPMFAENRRAERRIDIVDSMRSNFGIGEMVDLTSYESENRFLEGTGSIVFDHPSGVAYACLSPRTDQKLLTIVCERLGYRPLVFNAVDRAGQLIYHTNVMMCIAERFALVCPASISDERERGMVVDSLRGSGHKVIDISFEQMYNFAGNMLALRSRDGRDLLAMSRRAFECLTRDQVASIEQYCEILPLAIDTIETVGGGSARCMMAEIFLEQKTKGY